MDYSHIALPRPLSAKLLGRDFGLHPCVAIEQLTFGAVVWLGALEILSHARLVLDLRPFGRVRPYYLASQ
jgi:hypothetical protein